MNKIYGYDGSLEDATAVIKFYIDQYLNDEIQEGNIQIKGIYLIGSRINGTNRIDSDLDIVLEYDGDLREDDVFNMMHDEEPTIDDIALDFNPIYGDASDFIGTNYIKIK